MSIVKGDPKIIRAWTMYDWANSSYSLTITTAVVPLFVAGLIKDFGEEGFTERYGQV